MSPRLHTQYASMANLPHPYKEGLSKKRKTILRGDTVPLAHRAALATASSSGIEAHSLRLSLQAGLMLLTLPPYIH